jgi:S-formylglutathione hydrolase FrmB
MLRRMSGTGKVEVLRHTSDVLRGNALGDPDERDLHVYLPPSYETAADRRYPVVFCLTGYTGRGRMLLNDNAFGPNLAQRMDQLIGQGAIQEMIVAMPDCFTRLGGSQYINSSATGRYEDYLIDELVPLVDQTFRTFAWRGARAVMGKSSGGYGALVHAMRHADTFGLAASHSGDCFFEYCYQMDFVKTARTLKGDPASFVERFWETERKGKEDVPALNILAMASCYSPDPVAPMGFRLPFDLHTGEIIPEVWAKWLENDPVRIAERHAAALRSLRLLFIDAGTRDEFGLDLGARILTAHLEKLNVPFVHEEFDDGHFNVSYRYDRSLAMISQAFEL